MDKLSYPFFASMGHSKTIMCPSLDDFNKTDRLISWVKVREKKHQLSNWHLLSCTAMKCWNCNVMSCNVINQQQLLKRDLILVCTFIFQGKFSLLQHLLEAQFLKSQCSHLLPHWQSSGPTGLRRGHRSSFREDNGRLQIPVVNRFHQGVYTCQLRVLINNRRYNVSRAILLRVKGELLRVFVVVVFKPHYFTVKKILY